MLSQCTLSYKIYFSLSQAAFPIPVFALQHPPIYLHSNNNFHLHSSPATASTPPPLVSANKGPPAGQRAQAGQTSPSQSVSQSTHFLLAPQQFTNNSLSEGFREKIKHALSLRLSSGDGTHGVGEERGEKRG